MFSLASDQDKLFTERAAPPGCREQLLVSCELSGLCSIKKKKRFSSWKTKHTTFFELTPQHLGGINYVLVFGQIEYQTREICILTHIGNVWRQLI